jgi:hypothetical protein
MRLTKGMHPIFVMLGILYGREATFGDEILILFKCIILEHLEIKN